MKSTERHHLKENEVEVLARQVRGVFENRGRELSWAVLAVIVLGALGLGVLAWRERMQGQAQTLLAGAIAIQDARIGPPPAPGSLSTAPYFPTERERTLAALTKFQAVADAYPSSQAGIFARYRLASLQLATGSPNDAAKTFQAVIERAGDGVYGQMGRLGLAEAQTRLGQFEQACETFKALAQRKDSVLPVDGILMQLGRAYRDAGKRTDAQQTFTRVVDEFPDSLFSSEAKRELDNLKKG